MQHLDALEKGRETRIHRAEVKRRLKAGDLDLAEALEHPAVQSMAVFELLQFLPIHPPRRERLQAKGVSRAPGFAKRIALAAGISHTLCIEHLRGERRAQVIALAAR